MKTFVFLIITFLFANHKLFAIDMSPEDQAKLNKAQLDYDNWSKSHPGLSLEDYDRSLYDVAPCSHCAAPYALLNQVRKIIKTMPNANQLPELGDLELEYAVAQINSANGIQCNILYQTFNQRAQVKKLDGQVKQIAEGIFDKYQSIAMMNYNQPDLQQTSYYYRDKNNHIIQVIVDKEGKARFNIYNYVPRVPEKLNVDNLPDLGETPPSVVDETIQFLNQRRVKPEAPPSNFGNTSGGIAPVAAVSSDTTSGVFAHHSSDFHADIVPRNGVFKFIPRDVTLYDAAGDLGYGGAKVAGKFSSTVSRGHQVDVSVITGADKEQKALVRYVATTGIDGKFKDAKIIVPLSLNIGSSVSMAGEVSDNRGEGVGNHEQKMIMQFFEPAIEGQRPRSEYVTVNVTQHEGQPLLLTLQKNYQTDETVYTAAAGKGLTGNYVGVNFAPKKNPKGESVQLKFVDEAGHAAGYATYSRVF